MSADAVIRALAGRVVALVAPVGAMARRFRYMRLVFDSCYEKDEPLAMCELTVYSPAMRGP